MLLCYSAAVYFRYSGTKLHVFMAFAPRCICDDISSWYNMSSPSQCSTEYAEQESRRVANESARREEEFPEQKAQRLEEQAHQTARARSQESPEQIATRLQHDRQHKRKARAQETSKQTATRLHCEKTQQKRKKNSGDTWTESHKTPTWETAQKRQRNTSATDQLSSARSKSPRKSKAARTVERHHPSSL